MRYSIFQPREMGGSKIGEADDLESALLVFHRENTRIKHTCIIYDNKLKTSDLKEMIQKNIFV